MSSILVIGDAMLDRYWQGEVNRLSQEAPVPVVKMLEEDQRPGAAANVAMNCKAMGAETTFLSIVGDDKYGKDLLSLLRENDILSPCCTDIGYRTTQKLRIVGKKQQIVRVDFEGTPSTAAVNELNLVAEHLMQDHDVIIFSDYGKGALVNIGWLISTAKSLGKTVLVDPKGYNYERYRGADVIKPNLDEMRELVGGWDSEDELESKANLLIKEAGFSAILLTRASAGMTLFTDKQRFNIETVAKEVFDVSGAGDTAIAAFAVALTKGCDYQSATKFANRASGISVGRFGTAVVTEKEVFDV